MLISTFAVLGINPASAQTAQTQPPGVYYVDGKPYVSMDVLRNAPSVTQNDNNKTHAVPQQAHLANGTTRIALPENPAKDGEMTPLRYREGLTINIQTDDYMGDNTFDRDSNAYVSTTIDASSLHVFCHWEARLLRQVTCFNIDGTVAQSEVRWIATQSIGNDISWSGPSDWTPTFTQSMTLSELCSTGTWYLQGGSNPSYSGTWENWNRVVVYRIEIKQIAVGQSDGELVGITDFNSEAEFPYFGSWAIGHGEMQRFANAVTMSGAAYGQGRIDYPTNVVGGQDWNWMYMDGYQQYDTSYIQVTLPEVPSNDNRYQPNGFAYGGDLYLFSYVWSGYPSNLWLYEGYSAGGTVGMNGYTPTLTGTSAWNIWNGQVSWTDQHWTRFTANWNTDCNALTIFQQTPAGRYGSNFNIDSIVEVPTFQEPIAFH
jgi:hypothetical protein